MKIEKYRDLATRLDPGYSGKRTQPRSISNQKQTPSYFQRALPEPNDYDFDYGKNNLSYFPTYTKNANWTNYPSQYCFRPLLSPNNRKDAIKSRLKTMYQRKKCVTSNNFFKPKKLPSGLSSFISKYTIHERGPPDPGQGITIEQYFIEMEKRLAMVKPQHIINGKRCISTAAPACRQHYQHRDHSGGPAHEYSLGPGANTKVLKPLKFVKGTVKGELPEAEKIKLDQQSYHQRPASRYNMESICLSLDGAQRGVRAPVFTSWGKERRAGIKKYSGAGQFQKGVGKVVTKVYGQY